ncbi:hypothetical protein B0H14DRAFT_2609284 [Mycena olivaceomarginata]|nr:hypothetical protein B0H14DRAFT_2609284 [Mycena olivaceomarginata]
MSSCLRSFMWLCGCAKDTWLLYCCKSVLRMSVNCSGPGPETEENTHTGKGISIVTHHTLVTGNAASTGAKSRSKPKEKKETKIKEFNHSFALSETNYLELLRTILMKHGEEQYNITAKMTYSFKVQPQ